MLFDSKPNIESVLINLFPFFLIKISTLADPAPLVFSIRKE